MSFSQLHLCQMSTCQGENTLDPESLGGRYTGTMKGRLALTAKGRKEGPQRVSSARDALAYYCYLAIIVRPSVVGALRAARRRVRLKCERARRGYAHARRQTSWRRRKELLCGGAVATGRRADLHRRRCGKEEWREGRRKAGEGRGVYASVSACGWIAKSDLFSSLQPRGLEKEEEDAVMFVHISH